MSEPFEPERSQSPSVNALAGPAEDADTQAAATRASEDHDALPVLSGRSRVVQAQPGAGALSGERRAAGMTTAVQAAAVAAGGFVAGAALVGLVHRRQRRSASLVRGRGARRELRGGGKGAKAVELVQIVGSRSLLLDVHLLGSGGDR